MFWRINGWKVFCFETQINWLETNSTEQSLYIVTQPVTKLPTFFFTWSFITVSTTACHWSLFWANKFSPHLRPIHLVYIFTLCSHPCLGFQSCLFPSRFTTKTLQAFFFSPMSAKCPGHIILLRLIILVIFGEEYKSWSSPWDFLRPPVAFSLLHPNILLSALFSNTRSVCSSLKMSGDIPQPYMTSRIIVLDFYSLCFYIVDEKVK
jgi:hypothetical protein